MTSKSELFSSENNMNQLEMLTNLKEWFSTSTVQETIINPHLHKQP